MARSRSGGAVQSKIQMILFGAPFTGKSTLALQSAYLKRPDGKPFRVLYIDPESGSIDDYFPTNGPQHIGKAPGGQLGRLHGNGNRAPGNIFIYQSNHPFLWDKLSRSLVIAPAPPSSGAAVLPPARNGL